MCMTRSYGCGRFLLRSIASPGYLRHSRDSLSAVKCSCVDCNSKELDASGQYDDSALGEDYAEMLGFLGVFSLHLRFPISQCMDPAPTEFCVC